MLRGGRAIARLRRLVKGRAQWLLRGVCRDQLLDADDAIESGLVPEVVRLGQIGAPRGSGRSEGPFLLARLQSVRNGCTYLIRSKVKARATLRHLVADHLTHLLLMVGVTAVAGLPVLQLFHED